ncbi:RHS repeat-associated core domain-containing protein [Pseudomonas sp. RIT-PI-q]|uniref:RHS repeat-associated core domain-containing protein n=1 Tax=Pseudomonas sp. RIT-PI-q TaxID=1690247 RepID=UPI0009EA95DE|nr:RHS repeat-associated core domain-containing protein [Pseudomonas sp. RIT-PI-q]
MSSTPSTLLCHYRYDPLDRLINHTRADAPTQQRFYCKSRLATEIQGATRQSILQHGDLLLAQQQRLGDEVSATLLATDLQRSVLQTLEKNNQRQAIAYSPYGHRRAESGLTRLLGFNGERPDPVTGHYLLGNGYRAFNPVLMRFNSSDSWSPLGKGGLNSYAYCSGDPINSSDPNGHIKTAHPRITSTSKVITITHGTSTSTDTLRPGISRQQGEAAALQLYEISTSLDREPFKDVFYNEALNTERLSVNNQTNSNLQKLAIKTIQSNSIPTDTLPSRLKNLANHVVPLNDRYTVLEYINASRHDMTFELQSSYSETALQNATWGIFDASIPSSLHPTREAAIKFLNETHSIRHPNQDRLQNEIHHIRRIHFI